MEVQFVLFLSEMGSLDVFSTFSDNIFKFMSTIFLMNNYHIHEMVDSWGFLLILFCQTHVVLQSADKSGQLHFHWGYQMR